MKKNILLGLVFFGHLGYTSAQDTKTQRSVETTKFSTKAPKSTSTSNQEKALGFDFYYDNFDSIVGGTGLLTQLGTSNWVINNSGQTGPTYGWTVDNVSDGWWAAAAGIQSTSEGKYAEVSNGDPDPLVLSQAIGVTYTLTSGAIDVATLSGGTDEVSLSFEQYGARFYDNQQVFISTDGTTWQLVGDNSDLPMNSQTSNFEYPNPMTKVINIKSALAGGTSTVYIRFSWTSEFPGNTTPNAWIAYGWYIDDVKLFTNPDSEVAISEAFIGDLANAYSYSQIPVGQASPMKIGLSLKNFGVNAISGPVNISIRLNGTEVNNFDAPVTLPGGAIDTVFVTSTFTPTALGDYTVVATLPADDNNANNTATSAVTKTSQYLYAHDYNGTTVQFFDDVAVTGMGNVFDIENDQEVAGVNIRFRPGTTVGQEVEVAILEMTTGSVQAPTASVSVKYYEVKSTDLTAPYTVVRLDAPAVLAAGSSYMVYVKKTDATALLKIASSLTGDNDNSTFAYGPFGASGAVNYFVGWGWSPYVRLNFDPSLAIKKVSLLDGVKVYPNPSTGLITVSNENGTQNTITVLDITGKVVATRVANTSVEMNLSSFGAGIYMVEVSNENGKKAERVVIR